MKKVTKSEWESYSKKQKWNKKNPSESDVYKRLCNDSSSNATDPLFSSNKENEHLNTGKNFNPDKAMENLFQDEIKKDYNSMVAYKDCIDIARDSVNKSDRNKNKFCTNSGNNFSVRKGEMELYFSYDQLVGVRNYENGGLYVRENIWSNTTGKHINAISRAKEIRINEDEFNSKVFRDFTKAGFLGNNKFKNKIEAIDNKSNFLDALNDQLDFG